MCEEDTGSFPIERIMTQFVYRLGTSNAYNNSALKLLAIIFTRKATHKQNYEIKRLKKWH